MDTDTTTALVMAGPDGLIRFRSDGAERLFGSPAAEVVGRSLDVIVPLDYRERHWAGFRRATAIYAGAAGDEQAWGEVRPLPSGADGR